MQAGAREYPVHFPKQHLDKPGLEADLQLEPMYDAPHYKGSEKLIDKVALITGGDSGIGRAVAVCSRAKAPTSASLYLSEDEDAAETKHAVEAEGRRCMLIAGDVADPDFCKAVVSATLEEFGKLDMLVNNAAFQEHVDDIAELTPEHFDRTLKTNLYGYFYMAQAAIPEMKPGSAIIMTGSVTGLLGSKNLLDYSMTKGGIHAFTRSLASEPCAQRHPGELRRARPGLDAAQSCRQIDAEMVASSARKTAMQRPAQPEEIAPAFVFLAAPSCSSYITGEMLPVIGGYAG